MQPKTRLWLIKKAHSKGGGKKRKYLYSDFRLQVVLISHQLGNYPQYLRYHKHAENGSIDQAADCCVIYIYYVLLPAWHNWELRISRYYTVRRAQRIRDSIEEHCTKNIRQKCIWRHLTSVSVLCRWVCQLLSVLLKPNTCQSEHAFMAYTMFFMLSHWNWINIRWWSLIPLKTTIKKMKGQNTSQNRKWL